MRARNARCTVLEVVGSDGGECLQPGGQPVVRDLLPWADPYIAKLLARHRLQAALDDSLTFLRDDQGGGRDALYPSSRFTGDAPSHWDT